MADEPTAGEQRVLEQARSGEVVDLSDLSEQERVVRAETVRRLCLGLEGELDPRGIRISGAVIDGLLDLSYCTLSTSLSVRESSFSTAPLLDFCTLPAIDLSRSSLPGLRAEETCVEFDLMLVGATVEGELHLNGARIHGDLVCFNATIRNENGPALRASSARIGGSAFVHGLDATGEVSFLGAAVDGQLTLQDAKLANENGFALNADRVKVGGGAFLDRIAAIGEVRLLGAGVDGQLTLREATIANDGGYALNADGARAAGVFLDGLDGTGEVRFVGAAIDSQLSLTKATLRNENGYALNADRIRVGGSVFLDELTATGEVRLLGAVANSQLSLMRARIENENGYAVNGDRMKVGGSAFFSWLTAVGETRFVDATIDSQLSLKGASLTNESGYALNADRTTVGENALFDEGFGAVGEVSLVGATVEGDLAFFDASLRNDQGSALSTGGLRVAGTVWIARTEIRGKADLARTTVSALHDDLTRDGLGSWAGADPLVLDGFSYVRLGSDDQAWDAGGRIRWLEQAQGFDPGSWQRLIDVYRSHGRDDDARRVAIAMQEDRLRRAELSRSRKVGRWILGRTIAHGYKPGRAIWLAAAVVAAFAIVVWQVPADLLTPASERVTGEPQPILYSADAFLPIIDLGQTDQWLASGWLRWVEALVILVGWGLSTIFVAGFTRAVRTV